MASSIKKVILGLTTIFICVVVIVYSKEISAGVIKGMLTSVNIIIPSLLPFMVLSGFISLSPLNSIVSKPFALFTKKILKMPHQLGTVILMSIIGGYPVGAKTLATMLGNKSISEHTAEKMLCYCVNAGPSFVISAVGVAMFANYKIGVILFVSQIISSLIIAIFTGYLYDDKDEITNYTEHSYSYSNAFVKAVINSSEAMLIICAFVIIFSAIISLLDYSGILNWFSLLLSHALWFINSDADLYKCIISGILEVTTGCISTIRLEGNLSLLLCGCFISFGGLSVIFQVMSCFSGYKINFKPFIISRFANSILTAAICYILGINKILYTVNSAAQYDRPVAAFNSSSHMLLFLMLFLATIMLLSINFKHQNFKKI